MSALDSEVALGFEFFGTAADGVAGDAELGRQSALGGECLAGQRVDVKADRKSNGLGRLR